ncbi:MAG: hypothetical protein RBR01_05385 [Desulfobacterales bacterium]|nr:hypothetical protein [Desulfobacterales bacterium]MDY0377851.1 hypothetical protein [Desulfobacterales bacterium]
MVYLIRYSGNGLRFPLINPGFLFEEPGPPVFSAARIYKHKEIEYAGY